MVGGGGRRVMVMVVVGAGRRVMVVVVSILEGGEKEGCVVGDGGGDKGRERE